jgi:hypothetical protein
MPQLIEEMRNDVHNYPLYRDIFAVSKSWQMNYGIPCFSYYFETHENLLNKLQVLENYGLIRDISTGDVKRYRLTEEFVDFLMSK